MHSYIQAAWHRLTSAIVIACLGVSSFQFPSLGYADLLNPRLCITYLNKDSRESPPTNKHRSVFQRAQRLLFPALNFYSGRGSKFTYVHKNIPIEERLVSAIDIFLTPLRMFSPLSAPKLWDPLKPIFKKQWTIDNFKPTEEEIALLREYGGRGTFLEKQLFIEKFPHFHQTRKLVTRTFITAIALSILFSVNFAMHLDQNKISLDTYQTDSRYELGKTDIQIVNDVIPFPHTAVRIGEKIYSYGQTHIMANSVTEYLREKEIAQLMEQRYGKANEIVGPDTVSASVENFLMVPFQPVIKRVAKLPRTTQIVTLHLTPEAYAKLKSKMEMSIGKRYYNNTMVNDCATMFTRALYEATGIEVPEIIDSFPGFLAMYFAFQKSLKNPIVGDILQVSVDPKQNSNGLWWRDFYLNAMELKVWREFFVMNMAMRFKVDATKSSSQLQYYEPETQKMFQKWQHETIRELNNLDAIFILRERIQKFKKLPLSSPDRPRVAEELRRSVVLLLEPEVQMARAIEENPLADMLDRMPAGIKVEWLTEEIKTMLNELKY